MRDLARSLHLGGQPIEVPWPGLGFYIKPRTESLLLVLAAGGVGKSAFALEWAAAIQAPTLYVSLDTALSDHAIRLIARNTGEKVQDIEQGHDEDPAAWAGAWGAYLDGLDHRVRFADSTYDIDDIDDLVLAETEFLGQAPAMVIVDNLMNVVAEESASEYRNALSALKRVAKKHNTMVMALHHLRKPPARKREEDEDPTALPVRLTDALYEGDKEAKYVLGLWKSAYNKLAVAVLKNRMGPASPSGQLHTSLTVDLARFQISGG